MKQYYAVFDTNVLVSALLTSNLESPTVALLDLIVNRIIVPLYNSEILQEYPHGGGNLLDAAFAGAGVHQHIDDEANHDAVADAVAQRYEDHGEEGRDALADVVPVDLRHTRNHHDTHDDEGGTCGHAGNGEEQRAEEQRQGKAAGDDQGGETRAASLAYAGGALHIVLG